MLKGGAWREIQRHLIDELKVTPVPKNFVTPNQVLPFLTAIGRISLYGIDISILDSFDNACLEEKHGSKKVLTVIEETALCTAIIHNLLFPSTLLLGASGVVFAFIVWLSFTNYHEGEIPITFILVVIVFIGQQIFEGIAIDDNISNLTHVVGGIVVAVTGCFQNGSSSW